MIDDEDKESKSEKKEINGRTEISCAAFPSLMHNVLLLYIFILLEMDRKM